MDRLNCLVTASWGVRQHYSTIFRACLLPCSPPGSLGIFHIGNRFTLVAAPILVQHSACLCSFGCSILPTCQKPWHSGQWRNCGGLGSMGCATIPELEPEIGIPWCAVRKPGLDASFVGTIFVHAVARLLFISEETPRGGMPQGSWTCGWVGTRNVGQRRF